MPNTDIRIQTTFPSHWKTKKLKKLCGSQGIESLIYLWLYVGACKPSGQLTGMADDEIEAACDWQGDSGAFIEALISCKFIEGEEGNRQIHDWSIHNKWASEFSIRSERNRKNVESRWSNVVYDSYTTDDQLYTTRYTTSKVRKGKVRKGKEGEGEEGDRGYGGKGKNKKSILDFPPEYLNLARWFLPVEKYPKLKTDNDLYEHVDAIDKLVRIDGYSFEQVTKVLKFIRMDTEPRGNFPGWSNVTHSISRLRENKCQKFINALAQVTSPSQEYLERIAQEEREQERKREREQERKREQALMSEQEMPLL